MPQFSWKETTVIINQCVRISDAVADDDKFVPIRALVDYFNANLVLRPLLVEGMIASVDKDAIHKNNNKKWAVLIDSENYSDISEEDIIKESIRSPLPERLRNTIAHELVHSLAFIETEDEIKLKKKKNDNISRNKFIESIERETEQYSPLLLISDKFLKNYFRMSKSDLSIADLKYLSKSTGVSRYVLINRLKFLFQYNRDMIEACKALQNVAVGIGEWRPGKEASFKRLPLFCDFRGGIVPEFLMKHILASAKQLFSDRSFYLNGGDLNKCVSSVPAGVSGCTNLATMEVECIVEKNTPNTGNEFFYIIKKVEG